MIDHISLGVRDLQRATRFYEAVLATLGHQKLIERAADVGFGKKYPELWLNLRSEMPPVDDDVGSHIALRASSTDAVDAFYRVALEHGARADGAPGLRPEYSEVYYGAFVRDLDGHRVEAVTFVRDAT